MRYAVSLLVSIYASFAILSTIASVEWTQYPCHFRQITKNQLYKIRGLRRCGRRALLLSVWGFIRTIFSRFSAKSADRKLAKYGYMFHSIPNCTFLQAQSTQDAECDARKFERKSFDVACVQCGHPPFTSTGPICWRGIARPILRPVWIGPHKLLAFEMRMCILPAFQGLCLWNFDERRPKTLMPPERDSCLQQGGLIFLSSGQLD